MSKIKPASPLVDYIISQIESRFFCAVFMINFESACVVGWNQSSKEQCKSDGLHNKILEIDHEYVTYICGYNDFDLHKTIDLHKTQLFQAKL